MKINTNRSNYNIMSIIIFIGIISVVAVVCWAIFTAQKQPPAPPVAAQPAPEVTPIMPVPPTPLPVEEPQIKIEPVPVMLDVKKNVSSVKLISVKVSEKSARFLRKQIPFYVDLSLDIQSNGNDQRTDACSRLAILSDNFKMLKCSLKDGEKENVKLELEIEGNISGKQVVSFGWKDDSDNTLQKIAGESIILQERVSGCSHFFESRSNPQDEYESGKEFAKCINDWMITNELQDDNTKLTESERRNPQITLELFNAFIRSKDKPSNPFNWFLGVLSVQPKEYYIPYLSVFQQACLYYLEKSISTDDPLIEYVKGMNHNISKYYNKILKNDNSMINGQGIEEIKNIDILREKRKFIDTPVLSKKFSGTKDRGYKVIEMLPTGESTKGDASLRHKPIWIYNDNRLNTFKPIVFEYEIQKIFPGYGPVSNPTVDKYYKKGNIKCIDMGPLIPGHSIGSKFAMSLDCKNLQTGFNYWKLFGQISNNNNDNEDVKYIYECFMKIYSGTREQYCALYSDAAYLYGVDTAQGTSHLRFHSLGKTKMENGQVEIAIEESKLKYIEPGGSLIYGYDYTNKIFGLIIYLSPLPSEDGRIKYHGYFYPLN